MQIIWKWFMLLPIPAGPCAIRSPGNHNSTAPVSPHEDNVLANIDGPQNLHALLARPQAPHRRSPGSDPNSFPHTHSAKSHNPSLSLLPDTWIGFTNVQGPNKMS